MILLPKTSEHYTPDVTELMEQTGYPGMKVLEFAFDSGEENDYLPHKYTENCVVYTGTHDNDTVMGWLETAKPEDVNYARSYCQMPDDEPFNWGLIRVAYESKADDSNRTYAGHSRPWQGGKNEHSVNTRRKLGMETRWCSSY